MQKLIVYFRQLIKDRPLLPGVLVLFVLAELVVRRISFFRMLLGWALFRFLKRLYRPGDFLIRKVTEIAFLWVFLFFFLYQTGQVKLWHFMDHKAKSVITFRVDKLDINYAEASYSLQGTISDGPASGLRVMLYGKTPCPLNLGEHYMAEVKPSNLARDRIPGLRNLGDYLIKKGFYFSAFITDNSAVEISDTRTSYPTPIFRRFIYRLRVAIRDRMADLSGEDFTGLVTAMLYGDKSYLRKDVQDKFKHLGLSHVLVASGNSVSLLLSVAVPFQSFFGQERSRRLYSRIGILVFFACLSMGEPALIRASLMKILQVINQKKARYSLGDNYLYASILILSFIRPHVLLDKGFQMSCLATQAIYINLRRQQRRKIDLLGEKPQSLGFRLRQKLTLYFIIQLFLIPFLYRPGTSWTINILLANLLILPMLNLFLRWAFLLLLTLPLEAPSYWLMQAMKTLLLGLDPVFAFLSRRNLGPNFTLSRSYFLFIPVLIIPILRHWWHWAYKKILPIALALLLFIMALLQMFLYRSKGLYFLDVGQGNCSVLIDKDVLVFDGGPVGTGKKLKAFLNFQEKYKIDYFFISHLDMDHYAGVMEILEDDLLVIRNIVLAASACHDTHKLDELLAWADKRGSSVEFVSPGLYKGASYSVDVIGPIPGESMHLSKGTDKRGNKDSLVLVLNYKGLKTFFPGDIGIEEEKIYLESDLIPKSHIFLLAHHGSKGSNSQAFIEKISPELIINSASLTNRYGHPSAEVKERATKLGDFRRVELTGTIKVRKTLAGRWQISESPSPYLPYAYARILDQED